MPTFESSGISEEIIENFHEYEEILKSFCCVICLDIVKNPVECTGCESLYCEECWHLMQVSNKKCVMRCDKPVVKANRFVYNILSKLKIKCESCGKGGISYSQYILHCESCRTSKQFGTVEELTKIVSEKNKQIDELKKRIQMLKTKDKSSQEYQDYVIVNNKQNNICRLTPEQLRAKYVTCQLNVNKKMELYNAAVDGRIADFKNMVSSGYPMFEEVSAKNYYWTPLHYAMHYGKLDIVCFILDTMKQKGQLHEVMKLTSNDNRCPILCLLKSNALQYEDKKKILDFVLSRYDFEITPDVKKELRNRNLEGLLKKYRP